MLHRFTVLFFVLGSAPVFCTTTYTQNVKPILDKHCTECHDRQGHDPDLSAFPFYTEKFGSQKAVVEKMLENVNLTSPKMPPGHRPKLNQQQITTLSQWLNEELAP